MPRRLFESSEEAYLESDETSQDVVDPDDTEDALDNFMAQLHEQLGAETKKSKRTEEVLEQEDHLADLYEAMSAAPHRSPFDEDEDGHRKSVTLLPPVDHSKLNYFPIEKNILRDTDVLMPQQDRIEFRKQHKITVTGYKVPGILGNFGTLKNTLLKGLLSNIHNQGWIKPTPIQAQMIPCLLSGRDAVGVSPTGSGKTAAYLIPCIQHTSRILDGLRMMSLPKHRGPITLILCLTRELASQIYVVMKKLVTNLCLRVSCFSGGYDKTQQFKEIVEGVEMCVANPGRLIDLCTSKGGLNLSDVTFFVLDEIDRLLDENFNAEVMSIFKGLRPDRQVAVFSATFPKSVEALVQAITKDVVKVIIGAEGQAAEAIHQIPLVFGSEQKKLDWLLANISNLIQTHGQILIFCNSHGRCLDLTACLNDLPETAAPTSAAARLVQHGSDQMVARDPQPSEPTSEAKARHLFGTMNQKERQLVLRQFRNRLFPILVASDVASRGLDLPGVAAVINYDAAQQFDTHTHRIGRTGRAGHQGIAYTLLTKRDAKLAAFLTESLKDKAPDELRQLALTHKVFRETCEEEGSFTEMMRNKKRKSGGSKEPQSRPKLCLQKAQPQETVRPSKFTSVGSGTPSTGLKIFNPTDDIGSSSSEDDIAGETAKSGQHHSVSLLKPRRSGHSSIPAYQLLQVQKLAAAQQPNATKRKTFWD